MSNYITLKAMIDVLNWETTKVHGVASIDTYIVEDGDRMFLVREECGERSIHMSGQDTVMLNCQHGYYKYPDAEEIMSDAKKAFWLSMNYDADVDTRSFLGGIANDHFVQIATNLDGEIEVLDAEEQTIKISDEDVFELRSTCAYEPWSYLHVSAHDLLNAKIGDEFAPEIKNYNERAVHAESVMVADKNENVVTVIYEHYVTEDNDKLVEEMNRKLYRFVIQ
jgi:hypothetical protein